MAEAKAGEPSGFAVLVNDVEKAKTFFGELFGWTVDQSQPGLHTITSINNLTGAFSQLEEPRTPPSIMLNFNVDDVDGTVNKALQLGGNVILPPFDTPIGRFAVISDTQGVTFGVIKRA